MIGGLTGQYIERVDVIGNGAFLEFADQLERDEDITLDTFDLKEARSSRPSLQMPDHRALRLPLLTDSQQLHGLAMTEFRRTPRIVTA